MPRRFSTFLLSVLLAVQPVSAAVRVNEFMAAPSTWQLHQDAQGVRRLGTGHAWFEAGFPDQGWGGGPLPAGFGLPGLASDFSATMAGRTPTLHARRCFTVTAAAAGSTNDLLLDIDFNDGFVAYVNGREAARANAGAPGQFLFARQPASNLRTGSGFISFNLGPASRWLVPGTNLLAIEVHNGEWPSTVDQPTRITLHQPTPEAHLNAGLRISGTVFRQAKVDGFDFDTAAGARLLHGNTNGIIAEELTGVPAAAGWLARGGGHESGPGWSALALSTTEDPAGGINAGGGLAWSWRHAGGGGDASFSGPLLDPAGAWTPGTLDNASLRGMVLSFRHRPVSAGRASLRIEPGAGPQEASLTGFPVVGAYQAPSPSITYSNAAGGRSVWTMNASGVGTASTTGILRHTYQWFSSRLKSGSFSLTEDPSVTSPAGGSNGVLRFKIDVLPAETQTNSSWNWALTGLPRPSTWPAAGGLTSNDLTRTRLAFRHHLTAGRSFLVHLQPVEGANPFGNRIALGVIEGSGAWQVFDRALSSGTNFTAFVAAMNSSTVTNLQLVFSRVLPLTNHATGDTMLFDDYNLHHELAEPGENPPVDFAAASGGSRTLTVNAAGTASITSAGNVTTPSLTLTASTDTRSFTARCLEDPTPAAGWAGIRGHLRLEITQPAAAGSGWGGRLGGLAAQVWNPGRITSGDLGLATLQFACRIPAGVTVEFWAERAGGDAAGRVSLGTVTGSGNWQRVRREFTGAGAEAFRASLNAAFTRAFQLGFQLPGGLAAGTWLQLDEIQVIPWRLYEVSLGSALNGQPAFLEAANAAGMPGLRPVFEPEPGAAGAAPGLQVDLLSLHFTGTNRQDAVTLVAPGPDGGDWRLQPALAEPSGGVWDPGLLTNSPAPPAGEETDGEDPTEFVDWVELVNDGVSAVDLSGWSLSDTPGNPARWKFPAGTILAAGGHLLVLCDDRDEAGAPVGPGWYLHAGFQLDGDGGFLGLRDAAGNWVDGLTNRYPRQVSFCSYGRDPAAPERWGFLATATPGGPNAGPHFPARTPAPAFRDATGTRSLPGGLHLSGPLVLRLTNDLPGSVIRYTLDGSEPTAEQGETYVTPLVLNQAGDRTGIVVRAAAFFDGWLPSGVQTHTYLLRQPAALTNSPALLLSGPATEAFYAPHGILTIAGGTWSPVAQNLGGGSIWVAGGEADYNHVLGQGQPFEREVHAEYYFPPGYYGPDRAPVREDLGVRVSSSPYQRPRMVLSGAAVNSPWQPIWDATQKPSFNLFFRGDYGPPALEFPLFPGSDVRSFRHLRLRAGKNDSANPFITDELVRRLWIDLGHVGARGLFCSLYLNGAYKGVFNLTERLREPMFQSHYRSTAAWDVRYVYDWVNGDGTAYAALSAALDADLTAPAGLEEVASLLDLDNAADYFLLNIHAAMWDWPENNFVLARERSGGPDGRFRLTVWDAEGGFNVNTYYSKPVSYNTLTNDLLVPPDHYRYNLDLPRLFRRLHSSPEFRLRFADRIQRHYFNQGVLDDRDPDGAGPLMTMFRRRLDELVAEAGSLVLYNQGTALNSNVFLAWADPATGRRSHLLGTTAGRRIFRDAGLWPVTEPPLFSQHGGIVPPGYSLTMTSTVAIPGQGATLHYTVDGADPRLAGGAHATGSLAYTGGVAIVRTTTIRARARNRVTGEWSALTEATFSPAAVPADTNNLVIAELMYHPPGATAGELAAGFSDADDFEFVRLLNVGALPVDLSGVKFTAGIAFDFTTGNRRFLEPGGSTIVVRRSAAVEKRYGDDVAGMIAGEYSGGLANGGELLRLAGADGRPLVDFTYDDGGAWPESPDGDGPSLVLRQPTTRPDPAQATNWVASTVPGGSPAGRVPQLPYPRWRELLWTGANAADDGISGPDADPDGDGWVNRIEYALGLHPRRLQPQRRPRAGIEVVDGRRHLSLEFTTADAAVDTRVVIEVSADLSAWDGSPAATVLVARTANSDGTTTWRCRSTADLDSARTLFARLQIIPATP